MGALDAEAQRLMDASMAKSTRTTYQRGLDNFESFRLDRGLTRSWPVPTGNVIAYISNLSLMGKAASTIDTYVASIAYIHKINGWEDPTANFIIKKLKEGCRRLNRTVDSRRPMSIQILHRLWALLPNLCHSSYEVRLFRAAFLLAFFAFLRVGEFTTISKKGDFSRIISDSDIRLGRELLSMEVNIRFSKTDQRGVGTIIRVGQGPSVELCPVKAMAEFMEVRTAIKGPIFIHFGGDPLTRYQFNSMLKKGMKSMGLSASGFSSHSFRIGAATSAAMGGCPIEEIQVMGRWRSSAVNSYIRPLRAVVPSSWC